MGDRKIYLTSIWIKLNFINHLIYQIYDFLISSPQFSVFQVKVWGSHDYRWSALFHGVLNEARFLWPPNPCSFQRLLWRWAEDSRRIVKKKVEMYLGSTELFAVTHPVSLKEESLATFYSWRKWGSERANELPKFTQLSGLLPKPALSTITFQSCSSMINFSFFWGNSGIFCPVQSSLILQGVWEVS